MDFLQRITEGSSNVLCFDKFLFSEYISASIVVGDMLIVHDADILVGEVVLFSQPMRKLQTVMNIGNRGLSIVEFMAIVV